ncbi:hypothetical protein QN375_18040 [Pseudomonas sp. MH9.2]|uniref:hypothetical protein n=1 Tax=unclassified Pseudomonas TaxID=196821 RepID=UPI002AC99E3F|nr:MULTISPECIES: hypothetical protein [unclassified Pseudomonas]MEB0007726.1 hypothetical protein [Pseudomonas sp. RTB2]MEB0016453.1 hypothetical protein [Pseudomonas sp. RTB3]MEB0027656.1 hypothetical protein [Pseudomonas sp. MH9.2]MEB0146932.1 hypothetical protein [Pseudomonas sp. CCC2.2]MEB0269757.1 hypothetical protein [Pseudomonas sp. 5B4]
MKTKLLICAAAMLLSTYLYALAPSDQTEDAKTAAVVVDTTIEVRNNSTFTIYVTQKGLKQEVLPKATAQIQNYSTQPVGVTPVSGTAAIKYVTVTGKVGACQAVTCVIVQ